MKTENISILYIEDDVEDIEIFTEMLIRCGIDPKRNLYSVETMKSAKEILAKNNFDVIFLDLNLPDSNGLDTFEKILSQCTENPIIVMTGLDDIELSSDLVRQGAQDYLVKGEFDNKVLTRTILYAIERKKMEIAIRQSGEKHRALFEHAPDNVILVDKNRNIVDCNNSFLEMLGYKKEEVLGKPLIFFTCDEDVEKCIAAFETLKKNDRADQELFLKKKNGDPIPVWRVINSIRDEMGDFNGAIIHSRDFSLRREYEIQLRKHQEHIRLINKILRHDIANNLTAVKAHLKMFRYEKDMQNIEGSEEYLNKSIQLIKRMKELETFLDSNAELNLFKIEKIISHAAEKYSNLDISISGECQVLADHAIDSMFDNLFGNAQKHGKAKQIHIEIKDHNNMCMVRFCDDGLGIEDQFKEKVFEEKFSNRETGGTGLGLYIIKKSIERYGGYVFVEDNKPQGACFVLMFRKV